MEASLQHGCMQAARSLHRVSLAAAKCQQPLEEGGGSVKVTWLHWTVSTSAVLSGTGPAGVEPCSLWGGGGRQMWHVWRQMRGAALSVLRRREYSCQPAGRGACQVLSPSLAGRLCASKLPYVAKTLVCSPVMSSKGQISLVIVTTTNTTQSLIVLNVKLSLFHSNTWYVQHVSCFHPSFIYLDGHQPAAMLKAPQAKETFYPTWESDCLVVNARACDPTWWWNWLTVIPCPSWFQFAGLNEACLPCMQWHGSL